MALVCFLAVIIDIDCGSVSELNLVLEEVLDLFSEFNVKAFAELVDPIHFG